MATPAYNPALVPPGISGPAPRAAPRAGASPAAPPAVPFADVLVSKTGVQFSNHAVQRLQRRGIAVDAATLDRLNAGVDRAAGKGSRDAVVLVDQTAFVVSVRNKTVITAVDREHMRDHVFTNIDSAVIA
jgi:flagellar operon protein